MSRTISRLAVVLLLVGGVALLVASGRPDKGREEEIERAVTLDQLPAPVKATILKEAGTHTILEIEEVEVGDRLYYDAEWIDNGMEVEISVAPDGMLLERSVGESDEADDDDDDDDDEGGDGV